MIYMKNSVLTLKKWNSKKQKFEFFGEAETNTRICKKGCAVCGQPIAIGEGHRLLTTSSYEFIHKSCKHDLKAVDTVSSKICKVPFNYSVKLWSKENIIHTLILNQWEVLANNCIHIELNNLNPLKVIDAIDVSKMIVTITNIKTGESKKMNFKQCKGVVAHKLIDNASIDLGKYKY